MTMARSPILIGKLKRPPAVGGDAPVPAPRRSCDAAAFAGCDDTAAAAVQAALSGALTEMNLELRARAAECEALQETVAALAQGLHASDTRLEEVLLENERLRFKLQAVCFLERTDEALRPVGREAGPHSSGKAKKDKTTPGALSMRKSDDGIFTLGAAPRIMRGTPDRLSDAELVSMVSQLTTSEPSENHEPSSAKESNPIRRESTDDETREPPSSDSISDGSDDSRPSSSSSSATASSSTAETAGADPPYTPSIQQTAFVRALRERDEAQRLVRLYRKEAMLRRKQVRQLQGQLHKSQQLMELAYTDADDASGKPSSRRAKWHRPAASGATAPVQWLRNKGRPASRTPQQCRGVDVELRDMEECFASRSEPQSDLYLEPFRDAAPTEEPQMPSTSAMF